ncbi:hypothetical protein [Halobiforma nitratireducens]|uniref:Uncharacterized protein n=1 Tax=Halobiforma nitratireducens JCM 10879 TaxID=1227454 RepID=M0L648_9EURY|nr:hypothetical protein [Halobiforma nitratireducens]EMA27465.1 hypothetical protein C446_17801 [Halobiforma nitratireducens JCM 10879]
MDRLPRLLLVLAALGWLGTALSQLAAATATQQREQIEWTERRNQFLLLSSLSTNAVVFTTLYRYIKRAAGDR